MVYINNSTKGNILVHIDTAKETDITFVGGNKSSIIVNFSDGGIFIPNNQAARILCSLYSATIPVCWYNIRDTNNSFILVEDATETTISIPTGNYNAKTFASTVEALLNTGSPNGITYTMTYNQIKNKFVYLSNNGAIISKLKFIGENTAHIQMGFPSISETTVGTGGTFSTYQISMYDKFSIYLRSSLITGQTTYLNGGRNNIVERIPVKAFNTIANYEASPIQNKFIVGISISSIDLQLTYEDETDLVDLNGVNYQITLEFSFSNELTQIQPDIRELKPNQSFIEEERALPPSELLQLAEHTRP
jgi:hypothetical protein